MNITDEAVEAACIAGTRDYINFPEEVKESIRPTMRRVLEAAAPMLAATVLQDQATELRGIVDARIQELGVDCEGGDAEWLNVAEHIEARAEVLGRP